MKFDTVIIGAGLAGVTAAIRLAEEGRRVGLVSAGRSSMHFHSGSLGLLDYDAGHSPTDDIEAAINGLPEPHPYRKIGAEAVVSRASEARCRVASAQTISVYLRSACCVRRG